MRPALIHKCRLNPKTRLKHQTRRSLRLLETGDFPLIIFQKIHGRSVEDLARRASGFGIKTVYMVCDILDVPMVEATHRTVAVTRYLKSLYPRHLQDRIHVVHDGIEHPEEFITHRR